MSDTESGYVEVEGGRLYYEVEGNGPPVALIHAGVAHLRMWDDQVAALRDRYRLIRYDTRGFGRTLCEDVPYSNVADLEAVLDHFGVADSHLIGLSRGGAIALDFTVARPKRVRSLTWVASGIRGFEPDEDGRLQQLWPEMERLENEKDWEPLVELETQVWTDGPGQPQDRVDPDLRARMVQWNLENYRAEQPAMQSQPPAVLAAERLDELDVPILAIWGTFDESPVPIAGAKLAAEVKNARSHVFEGVAHMVNLERPAQFNELVGGFLDEVEATRVA